MLDEVFNNMNINIEPVLDELKELYDSIKIDFIEFVPIRRKFIFYFKRRKYIPKVISLKEIHYYPLKEVKILYNDLSQAEFLKRSHEIITDIYWSSDSSSDSGTPLLDTANSQVQEIITYLREVKKNIYHSVINDLNNRFKGLYDDDVTQYKDYKLKSNYKLFEPIIEFLEAHKILLDSRIYLCQDYLKEIQDKRVEVRKEQIRYRKKRNEISKGDKILFKPENKVVATDALIEYDDSLSNNNIVDEDFVHKDFVHQKEILGTNGFCWNKSRNIYEDMVKLYTLLIDYGFIHKQTSIEIFKKAFSCKFIKEPLNIHWTKTVKGKFSKSLIFHFIDQLESLNFMEITYNNNQLFKRINFIFIDKEGNAFKNLHVSKSLWLNTRKLERTPQEMELDSIIWIVKESTEILK